MKQHMLVALALVAAFVVGAPATAAFAGGWPKQYIAAIAKAYDAAGIGFDGIGPSRGGQVMVVTVFSADDVELATSIAKKEAPGFTVKVTAVAYEPWDEDAPYETLADGTRIYPSYFIAPTGGQISKPALPKLLPVAV